MSRHWTEADFLDRLYEVGRDDNHLEECVECRTKWEQWSARRRDVLAPAEVPAAFLAEQRHRIEARIDRPSGWPLYMKWGPAVAVVALALFVVSWRTPLPKPEQRTSSDAQLMSDIYRTVSNAEPGVVEPLRGLFESGVKQ
jgi:predicted anti-sigma-YlaC factor YlaD